MTDLAVSGSIAGTAIAFLVFSGWRNPQAGIHRSPARNVRHRIQTAFRATHPANSGVSITQQLIRFNAALQAEELAVAALEEGECRHHHTSAGQVAQVAPSACQIRSP